MEFELFNVGHNNNLLLKIFAKYLGLIVDCSKVIISVRYVCRREVLTGALAVEAVVGEAVASVARALVARLGGRAAVRAHAPRGAGVLRRARGAVRLQAQAGRAGAHGPRGRGVARVRARRQRAHGLAAAVRLVGAVRAVGHAVAQLLQRHAARGVVAAQRGRGARGVGRGRAAGAGAAAGGGAAAGAAAHLVGAVQAVHVRVAPELLRHILIRYRYHNRTMRFMNYTLKTKINIRLGEAYSCFNNGMYMFFLSCGQ